MDREHPGFAMSGHTLDRLACCLCFTRSISLSKYASTEGVSRGASFPCRQRCRAVSIEPDNSSTGNNRRPMSTNPRNSSMPSPAARHRSVQGHRRRSRHPSDVPPLRLPPFGAEHRWCRPAVEPVPDRIVWPGGIGDRRQLIQAFFVPGQERLWRPRAARGSSSGPPRFGWPRCQRTSGGLKPRARPVRRRSSPDTSGPDA
jgi:hypothetical protein